MARVSESRRPGRTGAGPVADPVVRRRLAVFATLLVACFVTSWLPLPFSLATAGFALWALVLGIATLRRVRRSADQGFTRPLLLVGIVSSALLVVSTGSAAIVLPEQMAWQRCRAGAVTVEAAEQCDREHRKAVEDRMRQLTGTLRTTG